MIDLPQFREECEPSQVRQKHRKIYGVEARYLCLGGHLKNDAPTIFLTVGSLQRADLCGEGCLARMHLVQIDQN
jgi:hypothetical protein